MLIRRSTRKLRASIPRRSAFCQQTALRFLYVMRSSDQLSSGIKFEYERTIRHSCIIYRRGFHRRDDCVLFSWAKKLA